MPTSRMTVTTSGWTAGPGRVPADNARALAGSTRALNSAAAICDRPALWTHATGTTTPPPPDSTHDFDAENAETHSVRCDLCARVPVSVDRFGCANERAGELAVRFGRDPVVDPPRFDVDSLESGRHELAC